MALSFTQQENDGTTATWFMLHDVRAFPSRQVVDVVLEGWVSEAVWQAGDQPLPGATTEELRLTYAQLGLTVTDPNNPPMPTTAEVYAALIALPQFAGAVVI